MSTTSPPRKRHRVAHEPLPLPREIFPARPGSNLSHLLLPRAVFLRLTQTTRVSARSFVLVVEPNHPLTGIVFLSLSGFCTTVHCGTFNGWEDSVIPTRSYHLPSMDKLRLLLRKTSNRGRNAGTQDRFLNCQIQDPEIITTGVNRTESFGRGFANDDAQALQIFHREFQHLADTQLSPLHEMGAEQWMLETGTFLSTNHGRPYPLDPDTPRARPEWKHLLPNELMDALCSIATKPIDGLVKRGIQEKPKHRYRTKRPKEKGIPSFCPSQRVPTKGRFKELKSMWMDPSRGVYCTGNRTMGSGCLQTCMLVDFCARAIPGLYRSTMAAHLAEVSVPEEESAAAPSPAVWISLQ